MGRHDSLSFNAHDNFVTDLDLSFLNFGGDLQSMEKSDLGWVKSSWTWRNGNAQWGDGSRSGDSGDFVGLNNNLKFVDGGIRED